MFFSVEQMNVESSVDKAETNVDNNTDKHIGLAEKTSISSPRRKQRSG